MNTIETTGKTEAHRKLEGLHPIPTGPSDRQFDEVAAQAPPAGERHPTVAAAGKVLQQAARGCEAIVQAVAAIHADPRRAPLQKETDSAAAAERTGQRYRDALAGAQADLEAARQKLVKRPDDHDRDHIGRIDTCLALITQMDRLLVAKVDQYRERARIAQETA